MSTNSPVPAAGNRRAEPESFRAGTLSASLTVKDLQKSLAWYRDVVGFTVDQQYATMETRQSNCQVHRNCCLTISTFRTGDHYHSRIAAEQQRRHSASKRFHNLSRNSIP